MNNQLAQVHTLLQFISSTWGSIHCSPCYQQDIYFINAIAITEVKARHCAYAIRNGCYPAEVMKLFQVPPSVGHAKRITKILRAETWRQARLLHDYLKVWCYSVYKEQSVAEWKFRECQQQARRNTEFLWQRLLVSLPKPVRRKEGGICDVVMVGNTSAPEEVVKILQKGPKFAYETSLKPPELLSLVRNVGDKAEEADRERCILDGVDTLPRRVGGSSKRPKVEKVVSFCLEEHLKLLLADKEGGFVLIPENIYFINAIAITEVKARHCAYAIRNGCYPAEVMKLFQVPPSVGHAKRITKILRAETWRQARLLHDYLKVWCYSVYKEQSVAEWKFRECQQQARRNTEFLWQRLLVSLPKPVRRKEGGICDVVMVGNTSAPEEVVKILQKGPKFAYETSLKPPELLSLVRNVGDKAEEADRERCILDGVDTLPRRVGGSSKRPKVEKVVSFCLEEHLKLLLADKEGGFVLIPENIYFINAIAITEVKARHCAYAIRNGCYPAEVMKLFQVPPSVGHAKRITKILRAETWRQARLLHDYLKFISSTWGSIHCSPCYQQDIYFINAIAITEVKARHCAYAIRNGCYPAEVMKLFQVPPSVGHAKRITKILRAETWRQARLLHDYLKFISSTWGSIHCSPCYQQDIYFINAIAITEVKARHCAYAIRNGCYPAEVMKLFQVPPSVGHAKRITKILRAETWRQARLLHDYLKFISSTWGSIHCSPCYQQDIYFINAIAITEVKARHCAYAIRNGCYPAEVMKLFQVPPSVGHAKRITKILRAETWRQARLLHDYLKIRQTARVGYRSRRQRSTREMGRFTENDKSGSVLSVSVTNWRSIYGCVCALFQSTRIRCLRFLSPEFPRGIRG
ncbi:hypothetical protein ISCGN_026830 [Ixodes scapularis]